MIVDTFMFNDEFEMLDIRLALTESYVDHWVILEGNQTWSGKPKPYHLTNNIQKYQQWADRITVVKLEIPRDWVNWQCENHSRASVQQGIEQFNNNDIVIHSDLDEILNPQKIPELLSCLDQHNRPVSCQLDMYIYRFDQQVNRGWTGPVIARKTMFENPQLLYKGNNTKRKDRSHCTIFPGSVGWHWTWIGNDDRIKTKVISCIESQHRDADQVLSALKQQDTASAINHKCVTVYQDNPGYPNEVMSVIKKYPYWSHDRG